MSTRTLLTAAHPGTFPEDGSATDTLVAADTANGNKVEWSDGVIALNENASPQSVTYTFSSQGVTVTKAVDIAAGGCRLLRFKKNLTSHPGDVENGTHVWLTGESTDVSFRAVKL